MAELVGDAYVRIHADTKFMHDAIERDLKKAGKKGADSLVANFDKTLKESARTKLRGAQRALADSIVGGDFDAMLKRSNLSIEEFVDKIAVDLARIQDRGKFKGLEDAFETLDDWAERAMIRREADKMAAAFDRDWEAAKRLNKTLDEQVAISERQAEQMRRLDTSAWRTEIRSLSSDIARTNKAFDALEDAAYKANAALKDVDHVEVDRTFSRIRNSTRLLNRDLDRFSIGGGLGRLFGKGSRNDFINFIGSAVGGIVSLGESIIKLPFRLVERFASGLGNLIDQFKELRAANVAIGSIFSSALSGALKAGIPGLIAFTAAVAGLVTVLPAVVSLASALLGGLTAAAGALYFAIAGTLLPLVPIIAALGAGLAPLALGIAGVTKAIKDEDKSVRGITKAWSDFQKATQPFVRDFTREVDSFAGGLASVVPFVEDMGDAVIGFMRDLRAAFTTPEMDRFIEDWQTTLPIVFDNIGRAISQLLAGLTAFFTPILPFAERLSGVFEDLTTRFNTWAASAGGQNAIKDFMDKAWVAADLLWDILGDVVTALHNIFNVGQEQAGGSLLRRIEELTERFKLFTESPEGQESIAEWFTRAKEAGDKLFTIIGQIFTFFETLDTEAAAENLNIFLTAMTEIGSYADDFARAITIIGDALQFSTIPVAVSTLSGSLNDWINSLGVSDQSMFLFGQLLRERVDSIGQTMSELPALFSTPLQTIAGVITSALANVPSALWTPVSTGVALVGSALQTLPGVVQSNLQNIPAIARVAVESIVQLLPQPFRDAVAAVVTVLTGGPAAIRSAVGGWVSAAAGAVAGVYTALTQPFRDAISYINGIIADVQGAINRLPGTNILRNLVRDNAAGGILYGPTMVGPFDRAGEAGREAIVPLDRPLSMIDPSVRALAAFAQGKMFSTGQIGRSVTVMPGAIVATIPNANPAAVAEAVLDRLVAAGGT